MATSTITPAPMTATLPATTLPITTGLTSSTSTTNSGVVQNPKGVLGKDSFMKLLLTELQYQDPTSPMDSGKILTQTSQLATLESADNTNKAMAQLVTQLKTSQDLNAISAIGKMASLGSNTISLPKTGGQTFEVYFPNKISSGTLNISDSQGNVVKTIPLNSEAGKNGVLSFNWDGLSDSKQQMPVGKYSVTADYTDTNGAADKTQFGIYPVESVQYASGKTLMKLGSSYVPMSNISEFY